MIHKEPGGQQGWTDSSCLPLSVLVPSSQTRLAEARELVFPVRGIACQGTGILSYHSPCILTTAAEAAPRHPTAGRVPGGLTPFRPEGGRVANDWLAAFTLSQHLFVPKARIYKWADNECQSSA